MHGKPFDQTTQEVLPRAWLVRVLHSFSCYYHCYNRAFDFCRTCKFIRSYCKLGRAPIPESELWKLLERESIFIDALFWHPTNSVNCQSTYGTFCTVCTDSRRHSVGAVAWWSRDSDAILSVLSVSVSVRRSFRAAAILQRLAAWPRRRVHTFTWRHSMTSTVDCVTEFFASITFDLLAELWRVKLCKAELAIHIGTSTL